MLVALPVIVYASTASPGSPFQIRSTAAGRWLLGLPSVLWLIAAQWNSRLRKDRPVLDVFRIFLGGLTGVAFILAGGAICSGIMDSC